MASISLLKDLSLQGWQFRAESGKLYLFMNEDNLDDKAHIRYRLSAERNAQFKTESVKDLLSGWKPNDYSRVNKYRLRT